MALALALTGCAAGQRAQTANEFSVVDGISADIGTIGLRNAGVAHPATPAGYAANGAATLSLAIVNAGPRPDQLLSVSSDAAKSITLAPASSASASAGVPASTPATANGITVPAQGLVQVGSAAGNARITLRGLSRTLVPGQTISVSFTFRDAGTVAMRLAVKIVPGNTGGPTVNVSPSTE